VTTSPGTTALILVRHGESAGNVAREAAEADGAEAIAIDERDPDVPLSDQGRQQATALGRWLADLPAEQAPTSVWSSPYVRAEDTVRTALAQTPLRLDVRLDERLRDRELGILDRLTGRGVTARYPDEAQRRRHLGKLYYRPPGGESWADVVLRLRSFVADLEAAAVPGTALVATHDAVIMLLRYVLEGLTEQQLLDVAARQSVGNASVTRLARNPGDRLWRVLDFSASDHLLRYGSVPTDHEAERDVHPH
jgi:glucosyl-3-phosphoglycerate phosphatase